MEVMLEEEVVRERARRVIPADGTAKQSGERRGSALTGDGSAGTETTELAGASACKRLSNTERQRK